MMYIMLIIGFVLLIKGADFFVDGSAGFAKIFHVPSIIIGLTIVAMGTSLPECAVSVVAAISGNNDIAISNVIGSNFFNLMVVCGICSLFKSLPIDKKTLTNEFPFSIFCGILLLFLSGDYLLHGKHAYNLVSRVDGIILLVLFATFLGSMIKSALSARKDAKDQLIEAELKEVEEIEKETENMSIIKCIILAAIGIVAIKFGGDFVVDSATKIATRFHMSQNMIGLTIVALGTSLPELVTSIVATRKGEIGMAVGNVVGSNIFNVLLVLGISATIHPISVSMNSIYDLIYLGVSSILVWVFAFKSKAIKRLHGCAMLSIYIVYMVYVCIR